MNRYLILSGCDNDMSTWEAESPAHAVEQFNAWVGLPHDSKHDSINEVLFCAPVVNPTVEGDPYVTALDGSWFGADDFEIKVVPHTITDINEIEDFLYPKD